MPHFIVGSASGRQVDLLNPVDINPRDAMHASEPSRAPAALSSSPPSPAKRIYACSECGKTFSTSGHMTRHTRVHTGEKNHVCPYPTCQRRCSRRDNLLQHFTMHLTKEERESGSSYVRQALATMQANAGTGDGSLSAGSPSPPLSHHASPVHSSDDLRYFVSRGGAPHEPVSRASINDAPYPATAHRHQYQRHDELTGPSHSQPPYTAKPPIHRTKSSSTYSSMSEESTPGGTHPGSADRKSGYYEVSYLRGSRE